MQWMAKLTQSPDDESNATSWPPRSVIGATTR